MEFTDNKQVFYCITWWYTSRCWNYKGTVSVLNFLSQKNRHSHPVAMQEVEQTIPQSVQFTNCKVSIGLGNKETQYTLIQPNL